jgi:hypothetical protein
VVSDPRAIDRCHRRAAELLAAGDLVLSDQPLPAALIAALDNDTRAAVRWVTRLAGAPAESPTLCLISARDASQDGSLVCDPEAARCAHAARVAGLPVYALLPPGPSPDLRTEVDLPRSPDSTILPADMVSAIVTGRGTYRPAMLARHLSDGDAPLDVIPLLS